jgi:hypothetical protein
MTLDGNAAEPRFRLPHLCRRALGPLVRIICPTEVDTLPGPVAAEVLDEVERMLAAFPAHVRASLTLGLAAFELGAAALPSSRGRPFSRLAPAAQADYFDGWWHSPLAPLRQFAKALKGVLCLCYFEHPRVKEQLGYDPDAWIREAAERRARTWAEAIRAHEALVTRPDPLVTRSPRSHVQA